MKFHVMLYFTIFTTDYFTKQTKFNNLSNAIGGHAFPGYAHATKHRLKSAEGSNNFKNR